MEEVTKSSTSMARSPGKGPSPEVTKKIAEMTSPLKKMKAKNAVGPAEILGLESDIKGGVMLGVESDIKVKKGQGVKAIETGNDVQKNNEKNAVKQGKGEPSKVANKKVTKNSSPAKDKMTPVEVPVPNPNGEVPRGVGSPPPPAKEGSGSGTTEVTSNDATKTDEASNTKKDSANANGDTTKDVNQVKSTETPKDADQEAVPAPDQAGVEPKTGTAEVTMQNETLTQGGNAAPGNSPKPTQGGNAVTENSPKLTEANSGPGTTIPPPPLPAPAPDADVEKGVVPPSEETDSPLPAMRTFAKHNSSSSMASAVSAGGGGGPPGGRKKFGPEGGDDPPSRRGTRKNLLHMQKSKRAFGGLEDNKAITESMLYETLRPCLLFMKITGIFFVRKQGQFGKSLREMMRSSTPLQIYCLSMSILLFLNFLRSMFAFDPNDGFTNKFFLKFLTAIFMYESVSR